MLSDPGSLEVIVVVDGLDDPDSERILNDLSRAHPSCRIFVRSKGDSYERFSEAL
jgi:hypothetical protein